MSAPEISRTHAVSMEDVGHETSPVGRHDGFARRNKARNFKTKHDRTTRKTNTGQSTADEDVSEEEDGSEADDETSSDKDDDDAESEEPKAFAPSGETNHGTQRSSFQHLEKVGEESTLAPLQGLDGRQTGLLSPFQSQHKKRALSEVSATSLYAGFGDVDIGDGDDFAIEDYEEAIKSSDDEDNLDAIGEEMSSHDALERMEEQLIIQEMLSGQVDEETGKSDSEDEFLYNDQILFQGEDFIFDQTFESKEDTERPASAFAKKDRKQSDVSVRRVRFEDEVRIARSTSDSSSDTDLDIFPDLLDRDSLSTQLRMDVERDIDQDIGELTNSDGDGSCWDFGEDEASKSFFAWHDVHTESESEDGDSSNADLSGYDSDGDTTDDDLPPPETVRAPSSLLHRRTPSAATSPPGTPAAFPRSKRHHKGPVLGTFDHDRRKYLCDTDPTTGKFRIRERVSKPLVNPFLQNSTESSADSSPQVPLQNFTYDSDHSDLTHLFTGPSDVMMSGVFGGVPGQRYQNGRFVVEANAPLLIGPPEAFYPFTSLRSDGTPETDDEDEISTEDDFDDDVDIFTAFLDVDSHDDEDEESLEEDESTSPTATDVADSTPTRNISQALIEHFDRGVVNSFRNNQDRYRTVSRLPHDKSKLSAPLRSGKNAETVMTPSRKRKNSNPHEKTPRRLPVMGGFN
ncbi:hypothetical protein EJ08DRAFT_113376 [Tothia fuscella]|uniref:Uncharacterized protein n=1 Tax=Tothia fuscella TaxID=1048955 RepID=A0A9P4NWP3_9PEZI|nr:hypothetical protein EJ08DRAFT_113376 [Tothia fuscella]